MFGLREQVGRNEGRIGAFVGDHEHLGGARGHVDGGAVGTAAHLTLGLGHVGVARTEDLAHARNRRRAEGHRGHGLGAAHLIDLVNAAKARGGEDRIGDRRRRAEDDAAAARDLGRNAEHQHRGKERSRAAGNVEAHRADRTRDLLADDAGHRLDRDGLKHFGAVELLDVGGGRLQSGHEVLGQTCDGGVDLLGRDPEVLHLGAVELRGEFAKGLVTALAHGLENALDHGLDAVARHHGGASENLLALRFIERAPFDHVVEVELRHLDYSIIFSIGRTRIELAPSALSSSIVSQKRLSLLTM